MGEGGGGEGEGEGGGSTGSGGEGDGGGEGEGGGKGASSVTTTVTPCAIATVGLDSTVAPSIADRLSNDSLPAASAWAVREHASGDVHTISTSRFTLAGVTCSVVWQSGG